MEGIIFHLLRFLSVTENEAGCRSVGMELPGFIEQASLGSGCPFPAVQYRSHRPEQPGGFRYWSDQVHLDFEGGVEDARVQTSVDGAGHGGIEEGGCKSSVNAADGVVVLWPGNSLKNGTSGINFGDAEPEGLPHGRLGQLSRGNPAHEFESGQGFQGFLKFLRIVKNGIHVLKLRRDWEVIALLRFLRQAESGLLLPG